MNRRDPRPGADRAADRALVLGGGVSGLTTAVRLAEAGYGVTLWTADPPEATTSAVAAAVWYPYAAHPPDLVTAWGDATRRELERLAREEPASGVRCIRGLELSRTPLPDPWWAAAVPSLRRCEPGELPPGFVDGLAFEAPVASMSRYLGYLRARALGAGVQVEQRRAASLDEALAVCPLVVNCVGLAAGALAGDDTVFPIRGEIVWVTNPGLDQFLFDDEHPDGMTYIVPRGEDCVLGGTAEPGRWDTRPDPAVAEQILARCVALEPRLAGARVLAHRVGLRPGRPAVRLEAERRAGGVCVHNYGHGGAGVTLSWGCADAVVRAATAPAGAG